MRFAQRVLLLTMAVAGFAAAQNDPPDRVGRLNYITGSVSFQPGGVEDWVAANLNRPLTTGDHLWVERDSRAELHIGGAAIRLGPRTLFQFLNLDDRTTQIRLSEGTLIVRVRVLDQDEAFEVDTPNLAFSLFRPGEYRIDANPDNETTTITVRGGEGEVTGGGQAFPVHPDQMARVTGNDSVTYAIMAPQLPDYFEEWALSRDRQEDRSLSARYVSREMIGYEDLDANGVWREEQEYGAIWVPRTVPAGWAPYRYGHWAWIEPWGWTWVDDAPWGFAPFHYGRWAMIGGSWGWIPGPVRVRPVYAPALVAWVGGPRFNLSISVGGGGGVAWFPLGPREVYVPAYHASPTYINRVNITNTNIANVNIYNNVTNVRYVNQTAPGAVTAVSRETFVNARPVGRAAMPVDPASLQNAQVIRNAAYAPSRESVLGRSAGSSAVRPPESVLNRAVVARRPPPPAPVPFQQRQQALSANPGEPLDRAAMSRIRAAQPETTRPLVRPTGVVPSYGGRRSGTVNGGAPQIIQNPPVYRGNTPAPARIQSNPQQVQPPPRRPDIYQPPPQQIQQQRQSVQQPRPEVQRQPDVQQSRPPQGERRAAEHKEAAKPESKEQKEEKRRP